MVHEAHGIGRYMGLETLTIDGVTRDYVSIQYAGSDQLFLPCDRLDSVSKYIGAHADDGMVKLSRFGGGDWKKAKARAKAAVADMAKDLIRLYAERMETVKGIGRYKQEHNLPVTDPEREREVLDKAAEQAGGENADGIRALFRLMMAQSREKQERGK